MYIKETDALQSGVEYDLGDPGNVVCSMNSVALTCFLYSGSAESMEESKKRFVLAQ
jgi:hypothetical protein